MTPFARFQFYLFAVMTIVAALLFVTRRNPVAAALWLVNVMFALSGLYVMLDAPFVAAVQVLVYAGAIMVVFIFVVMLLNIGRDGLPDLRAALPRIAAGGVGVALVANLVAIRRADLPSVPLAAPSSNVVTPVAESLFSSYLLAFEFTSLVLLAAIVGAVVLAKKRPEGR